jgi:hypothetical protein
MVLGYELLLFGQWANLAGKIASKAQPNGEENKYEVSAFEDHVVPLISEKVFYSFRQRMLFLGITLIKSSHLIIFCLASFKDVNFRYMVFKEDDRWREDEDHKDEVHENDHSSKHPEGLDRHQRAENIGHECHCSRTGGH